EQIAVALVRFGGRAITGVLAHGPEAPAIHRWVNAARERKLAWEAQVGFGIPALKMFRCDGHADRQSGRIASLRFLCCCGSFFPGGCFSLCGNLIHVSGQFSARGAHYGKTKKKTKSS